MADKSTLPAAPSHLPESAQQQWLNSYAKAFEIARRDNPEDEGAQRSAATKAANAMLAVPEPKSAADIDKLEDWQVLTRETREGKRLCVTSDGRKYAFAIPAKK